MKTSVELPDELVRQAEAHAFSQGRALEEIVAEGLRLLLKQASESPSIKRKRGSAGEWARRFAGVAKLAPGETIDDVRAEHYRKKYGL